MALTPEGTPYVESTDLVANYPAASLSLANRVDLVGVLPFADSAARATAIPSPTDGQYSYLQDTNATQFWNGSAWVAVAGGKILQVVNMKSTTTFSTTSGSYVDVTGMTLNITPSSATSKVLAFGSAGTQTTSGVRMLLKFTGGGSDQVLTTAQATETCSSFVILSSPNSTSAVTFKMQALSTTGGTVYVNENGGNGTITLLEVSA